MKLCQTKLGITVVIFRIKFRFLQLVGVKIKKLLKIFQTVNTISMSGFFSLIKEYLVASSNKRGATLSGALVFFTLLGIVPVTYIISLIFSFFGTEIEVVNKLFSYPEFNEISVYLTSTAKKMGASGNILVFLVALYSSANVFYHLKQSGEVIYNYNKKSKFLLTFYIIPRAKHHSQ